MSLHYDHKAGKRVSAQLRNLAARAEDVTPAWPKVGAYLSRQVRRQFATRGKHMGTPWKPLAKSTMKQKRRLGLPRVPLVRSGAMKASFIGRPMDIEKYEKTKATFGSSLKTALWQQEGTERHGKRHIPPRPVLKMTPEIKQGARDIIKKHIIGRKTKGGINLS